MSHDFLPTLAQTVVDIAIFLEFSDDETVDPDAAVRQMETLAYRLQGLSAEDQRSVGSAIRAVGASTREDGDFVNGLPDALGLAT